MLKRFDMDAVFASLADPTRRAIVEGLAEREASVSAIAAPFDMTLSAVHQHLAVLESAGLITSEKTGRTRLCRLDRAALGAIDEWLAARRLHWDRRLDALADYLEEGNGDGDKARTD